MSETDFDKSYTDYQRDRSRLRKWVRRLYLNSAASLLRGRVLDFGCGIGELLARLPVGSMGLEYNPVTVVHCQRNGLDVVYYDGFSDNWKMQVLSRSRRFDSMLVSHVLEHLEEPGRVLNCLLRSALEFGIARVLVIVPGRAGFSIDPTHLTFVDLDMLSAPSIVAGTPFRLEYARHFPGDLRRIGDFFAHHELQVLFTTKRA